MVRIGVDLDGVCYDFSTVFEVYATEIQDFPPELCTPPVRWEFYEDWGLTLAQFINLLADGVNDDFIFSWGNPFPGVKDALRRLRKAGHSIHIITDRSIGRPGKAHFSTVSWLHRHQLPYDSLTFSADKTVVRTDWMVDDKLQNVDALLAAGTRAVLMDRPWNQTTPDPYERVTSLTDFVERVNAA